MGPDTSSSRLWLARRQRRGAPASSALHPSRGDRPRPRRDSTTETHGTRGRSRSLPSSCLRSSARDASLSCRWALAGLGARSSAGAPALGSAAGAGGADAARLIGRRRSGESDGAERGVELTLCPRKGDLRLFERGGLLGLLVRVRGSKWRALRRGLCGYRSARVRAQPATNKPEPATSEDRSSRARREVVASKRSLCLRRSRAHEGSTRREETSYTPRSSEKARSRSDLGGKVGQPAGLVFGASTRLVVVPRLVAARVPVDAHVLEARPRSRAR